MPRKSYPTLDQASGDTPSLGELTAAVRATLDAREAAKYLGISVHTLDTWRSTKRHVIPYLKVGGRIRYRKSDLDAWLESCVVVPAAA